MLMELTVLFLFIARPWGSSRWLFLYRLAQDFQDTLNAFLFYRSEEEVSGRGHTVMDSIMCSIRWHITLKYSLLVNYELRTRHHANKQSHYFHQIMLYGRSTSSAVTPRYQRGYCSSLFAAIATNLDGTTPTTKITFPLSFLLYSLPRQYAATRSHVSDTQLTSPKNAMLPCPCLRTATEYIHMPSGSSGPAL